MGKLRHIAVASSDPAKTAKFYKEVFDFAEVGQAESPLGDAIFLSDGTINIAVVKFKGVDQLGRGLDYVGLHHFGVLVDDVAKVSKKAVAMGAKSLVANDKDMKGQYEVKHIDPDGMVFDLSEHPWAGSQP